MKKHAQILILLFLLFSTPLLHARENIIARSWHDLNAYFNTYYNAKAYFKSEQTLYEQEEDKSRLSVQTRTALNRAIQQAETVMRKFPRSSFIDDVMFFNSVCQFQLGRYERALEELEKLTLRYPDSRYYYEAKLWISKCYFEMGRKTLAYDLLNQFLENSGNRAYFSDAYSLMANLALQEKDSVKALQAFIQAGDQASQKDVRCNNYLQAATILIENRQYREALQYADRAARNIRFDEQRARVQLAYIRAHRLQGDLDKADEYIKESLKDARIAHYWGDIRFEEALILLNREQREEAIEKLKYIVKDPENLYRNSRESNAWARAAYRLGQYYIYAETNLDSSDQYFKRAQTKRRQAEEGELANRYIVNLTQLKKISTDIKNYASAFPRFLDRPDAYYRLLSDSTLIEIQKKERTLQDTLFADSTRADSLIRAANSMNAYAIRKKEFESSALNYTDALLNAAGLFLFELEFPDTAMQIYRTISDKFTFIPVIPQALYSQAYVWEHEFGNKARADSIRLQISEQYPESEFTDIILNRIPRDSLRYYENQQKVLQIEEQYMDSGDFREALHVFKKMLHDPEMDPKSAAFITYTIAWIYDEELSRETDTKDSTLHYYHLVGDLYPETTFARESRRRIAAIETNIANYQAFLAGDSLAFSDADDNLESMPVYENGKDTDKRREHPIKRQLKSPGRPRPVRL
ncbi:MAG: hypothetical protein RBT43_06660 [bacterium]|jgi:tetratricopeptide (TPR) repeat protein|nr:hypothetical protein [bacterium]